jgi:hypothetical protein
MILEIVAFFVVVSVVTVVGIRIGMLLAPRVARRLDREEKTDDRSE